MNPPRPLTSAAAATRFGVGPHARAEAPGARGPHPHPDEPPEEARLAFRRTARRGHKGVAHPSQTTTAAAT
eukprot:10442071-Alexandrium_andersonii.AAC.1